LASGRALVLFQHKKEIHHLVEGMTMRNNGFSSSMAINIRQLSKQFNHAL